MSFARDSRIIADEPLWYALAVRRRCERKVCEALTARGVKAFQPTYKSRRRWSDRYKSLELPLFPGYVFAGFVFEERAAVLRAAGVREIVGFGGAPAPVDHLEIAALRQVARSGLGSRPYPYLEVGRRARMHDGPLAGLDGILVRVEDRDRLVLSVSLLRRSVSVEVSASWVLPATAAG